MKKRISATQKNNIYTKLTRPYVVVWVMLFAPMLNYFDRNFSYFFGIGIVLLILWSSKFNWSLFGFMKRITWKTILLSMALTAILMVIDSCFCFVVDQYFGPPNLSSLEDIKHNTIGYIIILIVAWVFAAFGEEMLFRGYYLKWLAEFFGNSNIAWIIAVIITSFYFGISHYYQGPSGILSITFLTLITSTIFYFKRDDLGLLILMHGFHDTIGLTFLYLDKENPIGDWLINILTK